MKKSVQFLFNAFLAGALLVTAASCKKEDNVDPIPQPSAQEVASFTVDGDGFSNQQFLVDVNTNNYVGKGGYIAQQDITMANVKGQISATKAVKNMIIGVRGKSTGDFSWNGGVQAPGYLEITLVQGGEEKTYFNTEQGSIKVTNYGSVGGKIEGTFSGIMISEDGNHTVNVKNGRFSVERVADNNGGSTPPPASAEKFTFTLNGDGYSNKTFSLGENGTTSVGIYGNNNITGVQIAGSPKVGQTITASIAFKGKTTGTFQMDGTNDQNTGLVITIQEGTKQQQYVSNFAPATLKITKYEAVGGKIEGTFSGTFTTINMETQQTLSVTINNGKFSATRMQN